MVSRTGTCNRLWMCIDFQVSAAYQVRSSSSYHGHVHRADLAYPIYGALYHFYNEKAFIITISYLHSLFCLRKQSKDQTDESPHGRGHD